MTEQSESRAVRVLSEIVESGRPLVYIRSAEEQRVTALLREVASRLFSPPAPVWIWTCAALWLSGSWLRGWMR